MIHSLYFLFHFSTQRSHHPCLCIWKRIFERYSVTIDIFLKINTVAFLMFIDRKRWFKKNKNKLLLQMDFSFSAHLNSTYSLNLESDLSCSYFYIWNIIQEVKLKHFYVYHNILSSSMFYDVIYKIKFQTPIILTLQRFQFVCHPLSCWQYQDSLNTIHNWNANFVHYGIFGLIIWEKVNEKIVIDFINLYIHC